MTRPIQPLKIPDVVPATLSAARPVFREVAPKDLFVDETYQRNISERSITLIRRIVAEWSWGAFKPPIVTMVDGRYHVLDGQHTAIAAASHPGIDTIPVMIVENADDESRASSFVRHNRDRIAVTPTQLHFAMVAAGDADAVTMMQVCQRAGVRVLKNPPAQGIFRPGDTMAVACLRSVIGRRFAIGTRQILDVCVAAALAPVSADAIRAIEVLLFDPDYSNAVTPEGLAITIRKMGPDGRREAETFSAAHKVPVWRGLVVTWFKNTRKRRND